MEELYRDGAYRERRAQAERELALVDRELAQVRAALERHVVRDRQPSNQGKYLLVGGVGVVALLCLSTLGNTAPSHDSSSHCAAPVGADLGTTASQSPYSAGE